jgi:hypothetical protein
MIPVDPLDLNTQVLLALRQRYAGRRCFVIGNGPSLRPEDLDRIHAHGDLSIASNRIFLIFNRTEWRPTLGVLEDMAIARGSGQELDRHFAGNLVYADYLAEHLAPAAQLASFRLVSRVQPPALPAFSDDFIGGVHGGATITYTALQLAAWLGVSEVYLLGVDFNYRVNDAHPSTEFAGLQVYSGAGERNHFAEGYIKPGEVVFAPDMEAMLCAFRAAQDKAVASDRFKIFNATRGGCLEVFPRVDFDGLFGGPKAPPDASPAGEALALARSAWARERIRQHKAAALVEFVLGRDLSSLHAHPLIDHFAGAELCKLGAWGDASHGEAVIAGRSARTILLHPAARLSFTLPTGAEGSLALGFGMHPDVWHNPASGPCRFIVRVDRVVLLDATVDARANPDSRKWHTCTLPVAALSAGVHVVELETIGVGSESFRWALWRDPAFIWGRTDREDLALLTGDSLPGTAAT